METTPIYKRKVFVIPLVCLFALAIVTAGTYAYFHSVQVDLTVTEARSSADLPASLSFMSGETVTLDRTIKNDANVELCALLEWVEVENVNLTEYVSNLPMQVTLAPKETTTVSVSFTATPVTPAGAVIGTIGYSKIACS
jgi:predicted ribosomally synthesized peptide with SipW-like signal peptide